MTLLLLHGPAIEASRRRLQEERKKFSLDNVVVFDCSVDPGQAVASLMTVPMFPAERLIIWENPPEDFKLPTTDYQPPTTLILWFDHQVNEKKPIMEFSKKNKGQVLYFPESKEVSVFPFLDALSAKDQKAFLEIKRLKQAGFDIHYLLTMVFYLLRNLVVTPQNAPDFLRRKLARQRAGFSMEKIKNLYQDILEIDFKIKSGLLEQSQAEFLLVNKFI